MGHDPFRPIQKIGHVDDDLHQPADPYGIPAYGTESPNLSETVLPDPLQPPDLGTMPLADSGLSREAYRPFSGLPPNESGMPAHADSSESAFDSEINGLNTEAPEFAEGISIPSDIDNYLGDHADPAKDHYLNDIDHAGFETDHFACGEDHHANPISHHENADEPQPPHQKEASEKLWNDSDYPFLPRPGRGGLKGRKVKMPKIRRLKSIRKRKRRSGNCIICGMQCGGLICPRCDIQLIAENNLCIFCLGILEDGMCANKKCPAYRQETCPECGLQKPCDCEKQET